MDTLSILAYLVLLVLTTLSYPFIKQRSKTSHNKLTTRPGDLRPPPGSMGLPYVGETLLLYSQDPNVFFAEKQKRYGDVFKTHILGYPSVMLASPQASRFVLATHAHLFKPTYPKSKMALIGPSALFFHQGEYHQGVRKIVQSSISGPQRISPLIPLIEDIAVSTLDSLPDGSVICTFNAMKMYAFDVGVLSIFGRLSSEHREELRRSYKLVEKGYNCFPLSLPGTAYHTAISARRRLSQTLREIIHERKEQLRVAESNLLDHLLRYRDGEGRGLSDDQIADNVIGVLFAAQDTTASALTWIVKYLHDDAKLLEAVQMEQKAIRTANGGSGFLTWNQKRDMKLTQKVILESLRMSSIISFTFREAIVDVEYNGYLIPKGWKVMPLFRNLHHNPSFFPDPQKFDPSRFEIVPKPNTFTPFGSGVHACPGNELAKLEILIFLHHLVTKFRWEVTGSEIGIQYGPFPIPLHGLPARYWRATPCA
uniref:(+)-abscisic acid 8'-hydroxylase n=1 Tax=Kalanchoe fedtschenkoi TaxID=63787 RepID=A0A7N0T0R6_KALFE